MNRCVLVLQTIALPLGYCAISNFILKESKNSFYSYNDSDGNRTRVTAVKGRCLNRLTTEPIMVTQQKSYYHNQTHLASTNCTIYDLFFIFPVLQSISPYLTLCFLFEKYSSCFPYLTTEILGDYSTKPIRSHFLIQFSYLFR